MLLIGSCFSENISRKLASYKFDVASNPFGILFNPKAIETLILNSLNEKTYSESDVFLLNERWHCFDAHSDLSATDKNELLHNLNLAVKSTNKRLKETTHIIITLGTSFTYRFIETNAIVGNCHKVPQKKFSKELLSVDEISASLKNIWHQISAVNPKTTVIFTVSPVRHIKDGFVENSMSKAHLIAAIHQTLEEVKGKYFPSFEIMMDDLRDYRFYSEDMVHPNYHATEYVWEKFLQACTTPETKNIIKEVAAINLAVTHKPFFVHSNQHQQFLQKTQQKIEALSAQFPFLDFSKHLALLKAQMLP